ncbi:MAG TPA: hypothetical protein DCY74_05300, partial [Clostridiales bacterium]|nr:hypothetical protein [Clostridiales bacterium]
MHADAGKSPYRRSAGIPLESENKKYLPEKRHRFVIMFTINASRETTCCFSGHRQLPTVLRGLKINLLDTIEGLYKQGYRHFICGGALGFDTLAARAVLYLRTKKQGICLHLVLPCRNQCDGWSKKDTELYKEILLSAHA